MRRIRSEQTFENLGSDLANIVGKYHCQHMFTGNQDELDRYMRYVATSQSLQSSFYVYDLGNVYRQYNTWFNAMPRVKPFYAIKCNPERALLEVLAILGAGFDAASKAEIDAVMALGVPPERIIYANPCKLPEQIKHAASVGVNMTTFDSEEELTKLARLHPKAQLVLRIRADDPTARCPLGVKYGALPFEFKPLLDRAKTLGLDLMGVSFHVGSGATSAEAYYNAIGKARDVFDMAVEMGLPPLRLLDIGGGFSNGGAMNFLDAAAAVNSGLDQYFPADSGVTVIAEPGRYFAEGTGHLATFTFGKRCRPVEDETHYEYWISDGLYGSMNCVVFDHAVLTPHSLASPEGRCYPSTVFGPTCDGMDVVLRDIWLPELEYGDWLVFNNMGAYTTAAGTSFNGFATGQIPIFYVFSDLEYGAKMAMELRDEAKVRLERSDFSDESTVDSFFLETGDGVTHLAEDF